MVRCERCWDLGRVRAGEAVTGKDSLVSPRASSLVLANNHVMLAGNSGGILCLTWCTHHEGNRSAPVQYFCRCRHILGRKLRVLTMKLGTLEEGFHSS